MWSFELDPADLAGSRFAISPLHETLEGLAVLANDCHIDGELQPWAERRRPTLRRLKHRYPLVAVLTELVNTSGHEYSPDFLAPPPTGKDQTAEHQLDLVRATPPHVARAELARCLVDRNGLFPEGHAQALTEPDIAARLADALGAVWHELFRADWPQIRSILLQDLHYRAEQLLGSGWNATLTGLSSCVNWRANRLGVGLGPDHDQDGQSTRRRGFVFGPSVFGLTTLTLTPPWQPALMYPARGRAALTGQSHDAELALAHLIGGTRARLLRELDQPATTTQLTKRLHLSLGSVGGHLSALRASGLINGIRAGQSVYYHRTQLGEALLDNNPG